MKSILYDIRLSKNILRVYEHKINGEGRNERGVYSNYRAGT